MQRYPQTHFDFHAHNDYDLSVANVLEAVKAGIQGLHTTVNGMEKIGNAPLASTIAVLNHFVPEVETQVIETSLFSVSKLIETFSGIRIPVDKLIVGENVFTQTAALMPMEIKKRISISTICFPNDLAENVFML